MTTFLGLYRGAETYGIDGVSSKEGETLGSKVIAKAIIPDQGNLKVNFTEEGTTQKEAMGKVKKAIDKYLKDHNMDKFEMEGL